MTRTNTSSFYCVDIFGAYGMADKAMFVFPNSTLGGGWRSSFVLHDDGEMTMADHPNDFDVPVGGHGFGDQRVEIHQAGRSVRLYSGVSITGTTIITSDETIDGCALQQNYLVISTESGKLKCYDRGGLGLSLLATYQIPQGRGGMVTVDAARMPAAS